MIKGKKISLRLIEEKDLKTFVDLTNDTSEKGPCCPYILRTMCDTKRIFNEHGFFSKEGGRFLIENKASEIVGDISFFKLLTILKVMKLAVKFTKSNTEAKVILQKP